MKSPVRHISCLVAIVSILLVSCSPSQDAELSYAPEKADEKNAYLIHTLNRELIKVVSEDLFNPPVASRIYAYTNIAAYETARHLDTSLPSFVGTVNGLDSLPTPPAQNYHEVSMIRAYSEVAKHLVYRDFMVDSMSQKLLDSIRSNYNSTKVFESSLAFGSQLAEHIKNWSDNDRYHETRNMPRYQPKKLPHSWEATAPMYGEALEPHWFKIRPFFLDSASQFRVPPPHPFSTDPESDFYKAAEEVYAIVENAENENIEVAVYWDCNPGPTMVEGHVMQVRKQNTPGGHWLGIHSILAQQANRDLSSSTAVYAKMCAGVADGFIAAWDTKYAHELLRPETYINRHMDPDWKPKLESPLFPEFTSAHSIISAVAASILAEEYGNVAFHDNTNVYFGLPERSFDNIWQAAEEAARSRLLGGIHYPYACEMGLQQGKKIGKMINQKLDI